jgi:hypothetical protein
MFSKLSKETLQNISTKLNEASDELSTKTLSIKSNISDKSAEISSTASTLIEDKKENIGNILDIEFTKRIKDFAKNASNIANEIDNHLEKIDSPYEVSSFRVNANIGLAVGMTLDMNFTKTAYAKQIRHENSSNIVIHDSMTDKSFKIPKNITLNQSQVKVKLPENNQIVTIDTNTLKIIDRENID